ncbi:MAG: hypothetical protein RIC06_08440 [Cyclobacteriaceae bacterium]
MRKIASIILIMLTASQTFAQSEWSIDHEITFDRYSVYEGAINDKYPIIMRLEESSKSCNEMASRWTSRLVYGWYMYKKIGKKIPLVGSVCYADPCEKFQELFVPADPINYTFNDKCDIIEFKEKFTQNRGDKVFYWKQNGGNTYPVTLNVTHEFSWKTSALLHFQINGLTITDINLTQLSQNEYIEGIKLIAQKAVSGQYHILLEYYHQSNPGSFGHGACGAGLEEYIAYLILNRNFEIESFEKTLYRSCINNIFSDEKPYDLERPELGITNKN